MFDMTKEQEKFITGLPVEPYLRKDKESGAISAVNFIDNDVVIYEVQQDGMVAMQVADGFIQGWIDIH